MKKFQPYVVVIPLIAILTALLGSMFTLRGVSGWYTTLNLPSFTPPGDVIGIVWTILYILAALSAIVVWRKLSTPDVDFDPKESSVAHLSLPARIGVRILWLFLSPERKLYFDHLRRTGWKIVIGTAFAVNIFLNVTWSWIFFSLHLVGLAVVWAFLLFVSVGVLIALIWPHSKIAAYMLLPYVLWVGFAIYLSYAIYVIN